MDADLLEKQKEELQTKIESNAKFLSNVEEQMQKIKTLENPKSYGMPDLLRQKKKGESDAELERWRKDELKQFIEEKLWFVKDGDVKYPVLIPKALDLIYDMFYGYVSFAILWKNRGGGGSLVAAILIWLMMVYNKKSFLDMAGSGEQAKRVYEYTKQFWNCVFGLREKILDGEPMLTKTKLKTGCELKCVACSDKQVRGEHRGGFVGDESCQRDENSGIIFEAALQGPMSETEPFILLLSTFHVPYGFFADYWDNADEKGFKQYKWDIFDTMAKCEEKFDCKKCYLTDMVEVKDENGKVIRIEWRGCNGKARKSQGWMTYEQAKQTKKINAGGDTWWIEHCCYRPKQRGPVYNQDNWEACWKGVTEVVFSKKAEKAVGLDWGLKSQAIAILAADCGTYVALVIAKVFEGARINEIIEVLSDWEQRFGKFVVYPDAEEEYGNAEIEAAGFEVVPVPFSKYKEIGISNLSKFIDQHRLKVYPNGGDMIFVIKQMSKYHRNERGMIVKQDDHGPDAGMCAMLHFDFMLMFGKTVASQARKQEYNAVGVSNSQNDDGDELDKDVIVL